MRSVKAVGIGLTLLGATWVLPSTEARGQGALGFQPTVGNIPDGVSLNVVPAVTADRRYVRLSLGVNFQTIDGFSNFPVPGAVSGGGGGLGGLGGLLGGAGRAGGAGGGGGAGAAGGVGGAGGIGVVSGMDGPIDTNRTPGSSFQPGYGSNGGYDPGASGFGMSPTGYDPFLKDMAVSPTGRSSATSPDDPDEIGPDKDANRRGAGQPDLIGEKGGVGPGEDNQADGWLSRVDRLKLES